MEDFIGIAVIAGVIIGIVVVMLAIAVTVAILSIVVLAPLSGLVTVLRSIGRLTMRIYRWLRYRNIPRRAIL